jgi:uncharacterized membrane protein YphA (DoxX/SURF4 family)
MNKPIVVGTAPWLPGSLARSRWWTRPVRAERLAAFRIGVAIVLLADVLGTYLPQCADFFGCGGLGSPEVFAGRNGPGHLRWSLLRDLTDAGSLQAVLLLWAGAAACLLLGILPRLSAAVAWALSVSVFNLGYYLHNSGDNVRSIALFYLIFCPSAAAWSLPAWWRNRGRRPGPVYVHPWPLRLLFFQLVLIYFYNGVYKLSGEAWRSGEVLHSVLANLAWTRMAYAQLPLPQEFLSVLTYVVLFWELLFPVLVLLPSLRTPALWLGVLFHLGTAVHLQLILFPFYMLCLYLPLVPWERYADSPLARRASEGCSRPLAGASG